MIAHRDDITAYCNDALKLHEYRDYGPMGMQFQGDPNVDKIACAVSASTYSIEEAWRRDANLLIVHHGIFWNNESRELHGMHHGLRLDQLDAKGITLLAYHLCLDAHPRLGNNVLAARMLGLGKLKPWEEVGWSGEYKKPVYEREFGEHVIKKFGGVNHWFFFNPARFVSKVAVIVGGAPHYILDAKKDGFDTFFTGEAGEPSLHLAQDLEMNMVAAGHHRTERSGVQKLAQQVSKKFSIPYTFIDVANPV
jgi:dinuclear metal center YbgI/SA1388 family protein